MNRLQPTSRSKKPVAAPHAVDEPVRRKIADRLVRRGMLEKVCGDYFRTAAGGAALAGFGAKHG